MSAIAEKYPEIGLVILYGSVAEDRARYESDLDVAVMADEPLSVEDKIALIEDFAIEFGRPVDLVDLRKTHGTLLHEILHKGKRVYETSPDFFAETLIRHLAWETDFKPYRDRIAAARLESWLGESS